MAQGTLHTYHPSRGLLLFEHSHLSTSPPPANILLFVGGMYDNFLSPAYTLSLASLLRHSTRWRIAHIQLSSAMRGFGISSLVKDVQELAVGVEWVREHLLTTPDTGSETQQRAGKVVLMGHSTGCQDLLSYLSLSSDSHPQQAKQLGALSSRPKVDGVILQAPVSDREGALDANSTSMDTKYKYDKCIALASQTTEKEKRTTILPTHLTTPLFGPVPVSVERFESLISPESPEKPGLDDLFSSDGSDAQLARTFGVIGREDGVLNPLLGGTGKEGRREVLVLMSGSDEHVPEHVDMAKLLERWREATEKGGGRLHRQSRVVEGGIHDLSGDGVEAVRSREVVMRTSVVEYLADVLGEEVEEGVRRELERVEGEFRELEDGGKGEREGKGEGERQSKI